MARLTEKQRRKREKRRRYKMRKEQKRATSKIAYDVAQTLEQPLTMRYYRRPPCEWPPLAIPFTTGEVD